MSEPFSRHGRKRRRTNDSTPSTAECYEGVRPRTSGHKFGRKHANKGYFPDVEYNFRTGNFSEAPDSLANLGGLKLPPETDEKMRKIKERAKLLSTRDTKKKDKRYNDEEPLDIAIREQTGAFNRRPLKSSFDATKNRGEQIDMDYDDDIQEIRKPKVPSRESHPRDKETTKSWTDTYSIPKKSSRHGFGLSQISREQERDSKVYENIKSMNLNELSLNHTQARRENVKRSAIDLCSEGETDSEEISGGQSNYRVRVASKMTRDSFTSDAGARKAGNRAKKEGTKLVEILADINSDETYVPKKALSLSKAPSSSEGRSIKNIATLFDKVDGQESRSPLGRVVDFVKHAVPGRKSANVGRPIVPGASLDSSNKRNELEASLESNSKPTNHDDSLALKNSNTIPSLPLHAGDSSVEGCNFLPKRSHKHKSPIKKPRKCVFYDDDSSATPITNKFRISRTNNQDLSSSIDRTRSSARKHAKTDVGFAIRNKSEIVDMLDDSDDEQDTLACFDIARLAIGSSVKRQACQLRIFKDGILSCSYLARSTEKLHNIDFHDGEVEEVHYYVDSTVDISGRLPGDDAAVEPGPFIALKVHKTKSNGFSSVSTYVPGDSTEGRGLIVAEFRSDADMATFLKVVRENEFFSAYFSNESRLKCNHAHLYSTALIADARKEALSRNKKVKCSSRVGFLAGKTSNDLLLRFPFGGDPRCIEAASEGLKEFQCFHCSDATDQETDSEGCEDPPLETHATEVIEDTRRKHHIEIRVEDFERLDPGVYLNDTLIDFFLQWMTRKNTSPDLHVFTTHFYTALEDNGTEGVSNWTTKKKIDIFNLKFIFIPINKSLHWSFCVVVNPGHILSHLERRKGDSADCDDPMPCLLFFDSLKMHQKDRVHRNILKWLNAEWLRLEKHPVKKTPFDKASLPVLTPKVTYQNNSWDCGVFVCRYASGIFQLRDRVFSYKELLGDRGDVIGMITHGDAFKFSLTDIATLREEMKILIERLSAIYLPWKANKDQEELLEKLAQKQAKSEPIQENESVHQLLNTANIATKSIPDLQPSYNGNGDLPDSPESFVTQYDCEELENGTAKENVDNESQTTSLSETVCTIKEFRMMCADQSPSRMHLVTAKSENWETASV